MRKENKTEADTAVFHKGRIGKREVV